MASAAAATSAGTAVAVGALVGGPVGALITAAGAEAIYAWYDPDFFTKGVWVHAGVDATIETLNNYWQNLWRSGVEAGMSSKDPVMVVLDRDMRGWEDFRQRYNDSIFRRAADPFADVTIFGTSLGWGAQSDLNEELKDVWIPRFESDLAKFVAVDPRVRQGLIERGVDTDVLEHQQPHGSAGLGWQFYAGVGAVVTLIGLGMYAARR